MSRSSARAVIASALLSPWIAVAAQQAPRMYADVTVGRDRIAFVYAGQLWDVPRTGGTARRVSTTPDEHGFPLYSPDGSQLAYRRDNGIYVMPAAGGEARRLTWYPRPGAPRAWSPDGRTLLFVSARDGDANQRALTVPVAGGPETLLPIDPVRFASYSPDGSRLAIVGRSFFFGGVDRRYYRGGMRDPIWLLDPTTGRGSALPLGNEANLLFPMWIGNRIYFATDTLGSFNLAVHDLDTRRTRLLTRWRSHGITAASAGGGAVAFVRDGRIHLFDIASEQVSIPPIDVPADTTELAPKNVPALAFSQSVTAGPRAERVAIESRGDVLIVESATGASRNLTNTPGVAERTPVIAPDGQSLAYFSDASGEYALHVRAVDGSGAARVIPLGDRPTYFRGLTWSPDGRRVAFSDQRLVLWVADVANGRAAPIDSSRWIAQGLWQTSWSPDGRYLAYAKANPKGIRAVWLRDIERGGAGQISRGGSDDTWPVIDPSGRWLYFASSSTSGNAPARDVWSLLSDAYAQPFVSSRLMVTALRANDVLPVLPYNAGPNPAAKAAPSGAIDVTSASTRVAPLGGPVRSVEQVWMAPSGALVVQATVWPTTTAFDAAGSEVVLVDPAAPRPVTLAAGVRSADVSTDGTTLLVSRGSDWSAITIGTPPGEPRRLDLSKATVAVQPRAEWTQMFHEAFRMMRDYFYDPNHHGADVAALEKHYAAYLPQLTQRTLLNPLLGYAFGEISVSHLQVAGGDIPRGGLAPERTGVLGADVAIVDGRYRLTKILRNGPYQLDNGLTRAPLDQPGVNVREGEFVLGVDGVNVLADRPLEYYLIGKAARPTTLRVGPSADGSGARDVVVVPSPGENGLRRANWAEANRREVERRSNGALAYVWVDGWSVSGISELSRAITGAAGVRGLIIDQRWNGGGITSDAAIDALTRMPWYDYLYRYGDGFAVPHHLIDGPKVLIANESNFSAAETFAMMFKERRVGSIVGRRTGGGGIGGALFYQRLVDGGRVVIPNRASHNSRVGQWEIENHGVEPDVDVVITPADAAAGRDPQLAKAIDVALAALQKYTPARKKKPAMPVHPPRDP